MGWPINWTTRQVHVATSPDLQTWSATQEITEPYNQHWPLSMAFSQANGTIYALFDAEAGWDNYILMKTSPDGATWSPALDSSPPAVIYDHGIQSDGSSGPNGGKGFAALLPAFVPETTIAVAWPPTAVAAPGIAPIAAPAYCVHGAALPELASHWRPLDAPCTIHDRLAGALRTVGIVIALCRIVGMTRKGLHQPACTWK